MRLQEELEYFEVVKNELLQHHEGKYALIKGKNLIDTFTTELEAYEAGVKKFGIQPFLIKKVIREEKQDFLPALTLGVLHARL